MPEANPTRTWKMDVDVEINGDMAAIVLVFAARNRVGAARVAKEYLRVCQTRRIDPRWPNGRHGEVVADTMVVVSAEDGVDVSLLTPLLSGMSDEPARRTRVMHGARAAMVIGGRTVEMNDFGGAMAEASARTSDVASAPLTMAGCGSCRNWGWTGTDPHMGRCSVFSADRDIAHSTCSRYESAGIVNNLRWAILSERYAHTVAPGEFRSHARDFRRVFGLTPFPAAMPDPMIAAAVQQNHPVSMTEEMLRRFAVTLGLNPRMEEANEQVRERLLAQIGAVRLMPPTLAHQCGTCRNWRQSATGYRSGTCGMANMDGSPRTPSDVCTHWQAECEAIRNVRAAVASAVHQSSGTGNSRVSEPSGNPIPYDVIAADFGVPGFSEDSVVLWHPVTMPAERLDSVGCALGVDRLGRSDDEYRVEIAAALVHHVGNFLMPNCASCANWVPDDSTRGLQGTCRYNTPNATAGSTRSVTGRVYRCNHWTTTTPREMARRWVWMTESENEPATALACGLPMRSNLERYRLVLAHGLALDIVGDLFGTHRNASRRTGEQTDNTFRARIALGLRTYWGAANDGVHGLPAYSARRPNAEINTSFDWVSQRLIEFLGMTFPRDAEADPHRSRAWWGLTLLGAGRTYFAGGRPAVGQTLDRLMARTGLDPYAAYEESFGPLWNVRGGIITVSAFGPAGQFEHQGRLITLGTLIAITGANGGLRMLAHDGWVDVTPAYGLLATNGYVTMIWRGVTGWESVVLSTCADTPERMEDAGWVESGTSGVYFDGDSAMIQRVSVGATEVRLRVRPLRGMRIGSWDGRTLYFNQTLGRWSGVCPPEVPAAEASARTGDGLVAPPPRTSRFAMPDRPADPPVIPEPDRRPDAATPRTVRPVGAGQTPWWNHSGMLARIIGFTLVTPTELRSDPNLRLGTRVVHSTTGMIWQCLTGTDGAVRYFPFEPVVGLMVTDGAVCWRCTQGSGSFVWQPCVPEAHIGAPLPTEAPEDGFGDLYAMSSGTLIRHIERPADAEQTYSITVRPGFEIESVATGVRYAFGDDDAWHAAAASEAPCDPTGLPDRFVRQIRRAITLVAAPPRPATADVVRAAINDRMQAQYGNGIRPEIGDVTVDADGVTVQARMPAYTHWRVLTFRVARAPEVAPAAEPAEAAVVPSTPASAPRGTFPDGPSFVGTGPEAEARVHDLAESLRRTPTPSVPAPMIPQPLPPALQEGMDRAADLVRSALQGTIGEPGRYEAVQMPEAGLLDSAREAVRRMLSRPRNFDLFANCPHPERKGHLKTWIRDAITPGSSMLPEVLHVRIDGRTVRFQLRLMGHERFHACTVTIPERIAVVPGSDPAPVVPGDPEDPTFPNAQVNAIRQAIGRRLAQPGAMEEFRALSLTRRGRFLMEVARQTLNVGFVGEQPVQVQDVELGDESMIFMARRGGAGGPWHRIALLLSTSPVPQPETTEATDDAPPF